MKAMADHSCNPHLAAVQGIIAEAEEPEQATSAFVGSAYSLTVTGIMEKCHLEKKKVVIADVACISGGCWLIKQLLFFVILSHPIQVSRKNKGRKLRHRNHP